MSLYQRTLDRPLGVALVGAGTISKQYLTNLTSFPDITVVAVTDLVEEAARARAEEFGVPVSGGPEVAYARDDVDLVVNLTAPAAHVPVGLAAFAAGKHVWSEKPIATTVADARKLMRTAEETGLRLGCAPDTVLGPGPQTALRALTDGMIGTPFGARARMRYRGPESWHPNPAFLYGAGAGPLYDMGPYYLTMLVHALGPVESALAVGVTPRATRTVATGPLAGTEFAVHVPSTVDALLRFASGAVANLHLSFDSPVKQSVEFELVGPDGVLTLPDPNTFTGPVAVTRPDGMVELPTPAEAPSRGTGVLDMARALRTGVPHRASAEIAFHVLEILEDLTEAMSRLR